MSDKCEGCNLDCADKSQCEKEAMDFQKPQNPFSDVKKVIGVVSGKGGVGKSLVTSLLSIYTNRKGYQSAILDADVTGPSIPKVFGVEGRVYATELGAVPHESKNGIKIMSSNMILENATDPVVWRGPVIAGLVEQFWTDVIWGNVDYMFVDMPPGTGDVPLTVFQSLPVDGIVIVTSPQDLVSMIVGKSINMANMMNVPVLGIVENMSYLECPDCGKKIDVFGSSKVEEVAKEYGIENYARIPINPEVASLVDKGELEKLEESYIENIVEAVIQA